MKTWGQVFLLTGFVLAISTTLSAQTLISIDPDNAEQGESLIVAITGQNTHFQQGSGTTDVWFSQGSPTVYIDATSFWAPSDTLVYGSFDIPVYARAGSWNVNLQDDVDGTLTLTDGFTITGGPAPALASINPANAQQGQLLAVAITGQNTHFQQGSQVSIWLSEQGSPTVRIEAFWFLNETLLLACFRIPPNATTGLKDLNVYNDIDWTLTLDNSFTITPYNPLITTITPDAAYQGQTLAVTITGQNTDFMHQGSKTTWWYGETYQPYFYQQASGTAWFSQGSTTTTVVWLSQGSSTIFSSDSGIPGGELLMASFDIPADANLGLWNVHVPNQTDGLLTLPEGFLIARPGDLTCDGMVNFRDLAVLGDFWLEGVE